MFKPQLKNLTANLSVTLYEQDDCVVAYAPALDLSSYGTTQKEAQKNFEEAVEIFFSELKNKNDLEQVLESLGWVKNSKSNWQPPRVIQKEVKLPRDVLA